MKKSTLLATILLSFAAISCGNNEKPKEKEPEQPKEKEEEKEITPYVLENENGIKIKFDKKGARIDSLTYDDIKIGEKGFIAGRYANRIAGAKFDLDGVTYNLNKNEGNNHLHGGSQGFGEIDWTLKNQTASTIEFELQSADGDMGYPGNMTVDVKYTLNDDGALDIEYNAISDKKTILNLTNHMYMNLNGTSTLTNHKLMVDADKYTETDRSLIPTGNLLDVANTRLDYRTLKTYNYSDHNDDNYVLNGEAEYKKVAQLEGDTSGIKMELYTDQPGLQLYNTDSQICLETQHFPDSIHQSSFPSVVLDANEEFYSKTTYKFTRSN